MAVNLSPYGGVGAQFLDNAGNVLTGGKIETYAAGTTTPQATYTSSAGNIFHTNPIILDASGRVPSGGEIWLTDGLSYKFVLKDSNNVLIATYDNISGINSNFVNFTNQQEIQTATAGQTVFTLATTNYTPGTNSLSVFVDGVNQYGPGAQYAYLETNSNTVTFINGLHVGALVKFTTSQLNSSGATDASQVSYTPPFTNSVTTNVELKLSEIVSVTDFGAIGNGIADDTAAIQAAIDTDNGTIYFPAGTYRITDTVTFSAKQNLLGDSARTVQIVMTDKTKFAFKAVGVADTGTAWFTGGIEYAHGSFKNFDVRSRYGISLNNVNTANPPTYDYPSHAAFFTTNLPILGFKVSDCFFIEDVVYANAGAWLGSQPTYNSTAIPTMQQLYTAGIGVLYSNVYEGIVEDCTFLYLGIGVLFYGADISECRNSRFGTNLIHGYAFAEGNVFPSGWQTQWSHNDMLSSYSVGGLTLSGLNHVVENNYFENAGFPASQINYYIYDKGTNNIITANRFDDYGSTQTSGPILLLAGATDGIVSFNRLNDNRPGGAGNRAGIQIVATNWQPNLPAQTQWGTYQFVKNCTQFPRVYHPLVQYDLDGNSLQYSPLGKQRDMAFYDLSGGGIQNGLFEFQDASGRWYYNEGSFQNAHKFVPNAGTLAKGSLTYSFKFDAKCKVASPFTVGFYVAWIDGAGVQTVNSANITFSGNTAVETHTEGLTIPVSASMAGGYFLAWLNPTQADTYGITIT